MKYHSHVAALIALLASGCASPGDLSRAPGDERYRGLPTEVFPGGKKILAIPGLDAPLEIRQAILPNYPAHLLAKGRGGTARVGFVINEKGEVTDAIVIKASHEDFGKAAVSAILQWKFSVPMKNGKPVGISVMQDIPFRLGL